MAQPAGQTNHHPSPLPEDAPAFEVAMDPDSVPPPPTDAAPAVGPAREQTVQRSLKRNIVHTVWGNGVLNGCRFIVGMLMAKLANVEVLGAYTYANALTAPVVLFFSFNLRGAMIADAKNETTFGVWTKVRSLGLIGSLILILGLCAWKWLDGMLPAYVAILLFVGLIKMANQASELCWAMYFKRERGDLFSWSNIWSGLSLLAPFALLVPLYWLLIRQKLIPAERVADGTAIAAGLAALTAYIVYRVYDRPKVAEAPDCDASWNWPAVWSTLGHVLPLGITMLLINLADGIPRIIMEARTNSTAALGYFGALTYIAQIANLLLIQIGVAAANRLAQYYTSNFRQFLRLLGKLTLLALGTAIAIMAASLLLGKSMLTIFFRPEYAQYYPEFLLVIGAQCLNLFVNIFGIATTQMRIYWLQVTIHMTVLSSTTIAAYVLITPEQPVNAAAWTFMVRAGVQVTLYAACLVWGIERQRKALRVAQH